MSDVRELYQQLIVDHSKSPRNCRVIEGASASAEGYNPLCGDHVTLYVQLEDDKVRDISFQGNGCAISTASASLLTEVLRGKTRAEAEALFESFHDMVTGAGAERRFRRVFARQVEGVRRSVGVSRAGQVRDPGLAHAQGCSEPDQGAGHNRGNCERPAMKLTAHEEYGLRCLLQIGKQWPEGSLTIPAVSRLEGISIPHAGKLLQMLRQDGFLKSARGQAGGYTLALPPDRIVIRDVLAALGGRLYEESFCRGHKGQVTILHPHPRLLDPFPLAHRSDRCRRTAGQNNPARLVAQRRRDGFLAQ